MAFIEEGEVAYTVINGKRVPVVKCETEVVLRNTQTNYEYGSDKEAEDDIADPDRLTRDAANRAFREDPGAKSYSGGFDKSTGNYNDPFDPGGGE